MRDEAGSYRPAWLATVPNSGDSPFDRAILAAREALTTWRDQIEQLALHERAHDDAVSLEECARQRVCSVLDLVTQLVALPNSRTSKVADATRRETGTTHTACSDAGPEPDGEAPPPGSNLCAYLLGAFELHADGTRVTDWHGKRGPAVLQFLLSRRGVFADREVIIEALWPGMCADAGRHRLHQAIYTLRGILNRLDPGREYIVCENGAYRLDPAVPLWTDVGEFDRLSAVGTGHDAAGRADQAFTAYFAAEQLYRGDYLDSTPCTDWAEGERRRLRASYVVLATRLGELHAERGDHTAAIAGCARVLERDPWNEEATRLVMRSYAATGNRSLALQLFKSFETALVDDLGVTPSAEARMLYEEILAPTRHRSSLSPRPATGAVRSAPD